MAFQLSPGVNVSEIDLTTIVPAVATNDGAFAGVFRWGPIEERVFISNEDQLVRRFAKPTNFNAETWFTAANFLSYTNRLYISRAAHTTGATPTVSGNTTGANNIVLISNTSAITVGMYLTQCSNASITFGNSSVNTATLSRISVLSKNSSSVTLSSNTTASQSNVSFYFARPETTYNALGFDDPNNNAVAANLVNQIVKNENHYIEKDGTFDTDVIYIAKYPGDIGNSLRVSVCDNSNSFASNISLATANATVNAAVEFRFGSNTVSIHFPAAANTIASSNTSYLLAIGDQILAGNSTIGLQYMQVKTITVQNNYSWNGNVTANATVNAAANVDVDINFIRTGNSIFTNGEVVTYVSSNVSGDLGGITSGNRYYITEANSTGFKLASTPFGSEIDISLNYDPNPKFIANSSVVKIQFEDPYRLRSPYVTQTLERNWEFFNVVDTAPGQSNYQLYNGNTSANDELHVVVIDDKGGFTGTPGTVLEVFKGVSRATDATTLDGSDNYYKNVINKTSQYIWWAADRSTARSNTALNLTSSTSGEPANIQLRLGADGLSEANATLSILAAGYELFQSPEDVDISLVLQGKPIGGTTVQDGRTVSNFQLANWIIDNIVGGSNFDPENKNGRRDCVAFVSPDKATVLNNVGDEALDLKSWRNALRSSSYAVMDSGYKYQYDRYNDVYRWIPLNGDVAGLCARTDMTNDAWWSPAGFNRGQIKNLVKLAYNPKRPERDILYPAGINPVVTFPGEGTVLYGDKTLQSKPSAFDRINVRRLFITLEKAISVAAKYSLFEFNDAFTRAQFRNLVIPYLRTIKGRRGITDFLVVCDDTNNTPQIIDSNQFVGDIYIKPARSINFIQLNFIAVPTGVQFSEVIGKF